MIITKKWLEDHNACSEGKNWFLSEGILDLIAGVQNLLAKSHYSWAIWLLSRIFTQKQNVLFAIYSAERGLKIFEKMYPKDKHPRQAIQAAKNWVKNPTQKNKDAASAAAAYAADAAYAAYAASAAASAAAYAAYAASAAASAAAYAAAAAAADSAAYAADAAYAAAAADAAYAYAAYAASAAASAAAYAAAAADSAAAYAAAAAAADSATYARTKIQKKIIAYGIKIYKEI